ncbi:MAG: helix-turn-helix domain-containing protein [Pseudonocardia sp.]|nr:helix-turn-helix domain-containing protein [Pseudonocardia sp.]
MSVLATIPRSPRAASDPDALVTVLSELAALMPGTSLPDLLDAVAHRLCGLLGAVGCTVVPRCDGGRLRGRPGSARLVVPVAAGDETIASLHVVDRRERVFDDEDVALAGRVARFAATLAAQAAGAARLELLERQDALRSRLSRAALGGADAPAVVALLAELTGKPVVHYGTDLDVLGWSAPPGLGLDRAPALVPHARALPRVRDVLAGLDADRPVATVAARPALGIGHRHLVAALVAEGRMSGYLGIVEMGGRLGPLDAGLAEHGALVLSLRLLADSRRDEAAARERDDLLADLLRGGDDPRIGRRARACGIALDEAHVLFRLAVPDPASPLPAAVRRSLVVRAASRVLGAEPPAVQVPGAVVVLVPAASRGIAAAVLQGLGDGAGVRRVVVSEVCTGPGDYPRAHVEAARVDELAAAFGRESGVLAVDELGAVRLVVSSGRVEEARRFAEDVLGPLRRAGLLDTLRAYLDAAAQVRATARALGVHANTVRYRLGRVAEVSGLDVRDFDALLTAQLAFGVLGLGRPESGHPESGGPDRAARLAE